MTQKKTWTIVEAKARLSEILRLAREEGYQTIGTQKKYVIVPEEVWNRYQTPKKAMGQWLVDNIPKGAGLELPDRQDPPRVIPFAEEEE